MVRDCGRCTHWGRITRHGGGTETGWCELWGKVMRNDSGCGLYVRAQGDARRITDFDVNIGIDTFQKRQEGKLPAFRPGGGPQPADTNALRARTARRRVA